MVLHDWAEIQIIFSCISGWTLTSAVLWSVPGSLGLTRTDKDKVLGAGSTCEPRTPSGFQPGSHSHEVVQFSPEHENGPPQPLSCQHFQQLHQPGLSIALATKGTDAVVHGEQVKEAKTSEKEKGDDILPPHYFSYASMIVSGRGTPLKGQKGSFYLSKIYILSFVLK